MPPHGWGTGTGIGVRTEQVTAYRLSAHHLASRLPDGSLAEAAAACGIQDSPPGSALLALHARVAGLTRDQLAGAIEAKTLLLAWCMRGAPFVVPTAEAAVFTTGALPVGEAPRRRFIVGVEQALASLRMSLGEAVERTDAELAAVLSGRRLAIGELGAELAGRMAAGLAAGQREVWLSQGPYAAGQPLGEGVVHFALRILSLEGRVCFAPREGSRTPFVLAGEWLDPPPPRLEGAAARAELARRHLHCYGPSTAEHLASWVGAGSVDAGQWWDQIAGEVTAVSVEGRAAWMLTRDVDALLAAALPRGVRLLPPRDPYIQARDRTTLVADPRLHPLVWRRTGEPGTVLADGRLVGTWRPQKSGSRLTVHVVPFERLPPDLRVRVEEEAESIAPLRGASAVAVSFGAAIDR